MADRVQADSLRLAELARPRKKAPYEIAQERHARRTPADVDRIRMAWNDRHFSREQIDNFNELERKIGIKRGLMMNYEKANKGKENPNYNKGDGFNINCQTCVPVHLLRRLGFNVKAKSNNKNAIYKILNQNGIKWDKNLFIKQDGSDAKFSWGYAYMKAKGIKRMKPSDIEYFFISEMKDDGLYEVYCAWKGRNAHVFCAEVKKGKITYFDPQTGEINVNYIADMKTNGMIAVLRIDDKLVNPKAAPIFDIY